MKTSKERIYTEHRAKNWTTKHSNWKERAMGLPQFLTYFWPPKHLGGLYHSVQGFSHTDKPMIAHLHLPDICYGFPWCCPRASVFYSDSYQSCLTKTRERKVGNLAKYHFYYHVLKKFRDMSNGQLINNQNQNIKIREFQNLFSLVIFLL